MNGRIVLYGVFALFCGGLGQELIGWGPLAGWVPFICSSAACLVCLGIERKRGWPE